MFLGSADASQSVPLEIILPKVELTPEEEADILEEGAEWDDEDYVSPEEQVGLLEYEEVVEDWDYERHCWKRPEPSEEDLAADALYSDAAPPDYGTLVPQEVCRCAAASLPPEAPCHRKSSSSRRCPHGTFQQCVQVTRVLIDGIRIAVASAAFARLCIDSDSMGIPVVCDHSHVSLQVGRGDHNHCGCECRAHPGAERPRVPGGGAFGPQPCRLAAPPSLQRLPPTAAQSPAAAAC